VITDHELEGVAQENKHGIFTVSGGVMSLPPFVTY
jgi:hypothetical protein